MADDAHLRADARANKNRLLEVARDALAADPNTSLNAIAKAAGVGAGTLYRHFPSRGALVLAMYRKEIDALVALAPTLLARSPPLQALRAWCDHLVQFGRMKHGVADLLQAVATEQDLQATYGPMLTAVRQLIAACEAVGAIRGATDPEDVLVLLGLLWRIPTDAAGMARTNRLIELLFRGLGAAPTPLQEFARDTSAHQV